MARRYDTFSSVPSNRNARKRQARAARLGTRVVSQSVNVGDAARAVDAVRAVKAGWLASTESFPVAVRAAWAARSS